LSLELYDVKDPDKPLWWLDSKEIGDAAQQKLMQLKR
jgi:hypothetical protein